MSLQYFIVSTSVGGRRKNEERLFVGPRCDEKGIRGTGEERGSRVRGRRDQGNGKRMVVRGRRIKRENEESWMSMVKRNDCLHDL